jgi:ABC-type uncharacterized transport system fused permease/ATPase subunit
LHLHVKVFSLKLTILLLGVQDFPEFGKGLAAFAALAIPAATVNSGLKYMQTMIQLAFMKRLSHHLHNQYCNNRAYYSASQLKGVANFSGLANIASGCLV